VKIEVRPTELALKALGIVTRHQPGLGPCPYGEVPERPKGSDCKSDGNAFAGSNPALPTNHHLDCHDGHVPQARLVSVEQLSGVDRHTLEPHKRA
jgi:hypothetical protein